jgi:hypothetical protein
MNWSCRELAAIPIDVIVRKASTVINDGPLQTMLFASHCRLHSLIRLRLQDLALKTLVSITVQTRDFGFELT